MKRKLITLILALSGLFIIGYAIILYLGFFKEQEAGILVESEPNATIFINGVERGKTPFQIKTVAGEIVLRIKPDQLDGQILDDYETKVNLVSGIQTIIKREFNESEDYSSGFVVSFEKIANDDAYVTVVSVPDNAGISIDNKIYGNTPQRIKIPAGDHNLVVSSDKYLEELLQIKVYKGFKLTASVKLAKSGEVKTAPTPAPEVKKLERIKINKNEVGFLRVRSGANIGFPEVARVKPDEEYEILEEGERGKWYKIQVREIQGWVSSEFVTKITS